MRTREAVGWHQRRAFGKIAEDRVGFGEARRVVDLHDNEIVGGPLRSADVEPVVEGVELENVQPTTLVGDECK